MLVLRAPLSHRRFDSLTVEELDWQKCYGQLLAVNDHYSDLGLCDVCGKRATGPCALAVPGS